MCIRDRDKEGKYVRRERYAGSMSRSFYVGEHVTCLLYTSLGAHIDSPRMDIKQNPLYESNNMAYLDTHYYGGIKKYQWVTLPLAIHGVVVKKDGTKVEVNIGEKDTDPVFCVTDLLIHLAGQQMEKNAAKVIEGENLDILAVSYTHLDVYKRQFRNFYLKQG